MAPTDDPTEAFRAGLVRWLDGVTVPEGLRDFGSTPTEDDVEPARAWQRLLHEAGYAGLGWPVEHGGRGATLAEEAAFAEELAARGLPRQMSFVTLELAGPAVIRFGTDAQRARHLPAILRGDEVWCQLFSEPEAGSDLAGVRARAEASDDGWVVSGHKVWTSGAHYSDLGFLLARTDPSASRHRGLTCFVLPMRSAGVEVHPIVQMDGESKFNEVFLDGVRVERDQVLGDVGGGWEVAVSILGRERRMLGSVAIGLAASLRELRALAERDGRASEGFVELWVRLWTETDLLRWTWLRLLSTADADDPADPRMSVLKLTSSRLQQEIAELAADLLGPDFADDEAGAGWRQRFLAAHGATIAGGTSEIQRDILSTRVLGLPR